jgi:hypothetical protein
MTAAQIGARVHQLCDQRGIPAGQDPVRIRMLMLAAEALRRGQDPVDRVEKQLALMFNEVEFDQEPTAASPTPPIIRGRIIQP